MIHHLSAGTNDIARRLIPVQCRNARGRQAATPGNGVHIAFVAGRRAMVDLFYETALAYEGRDAGPPGLRPQYDAHYFGAFVFDPDGNKIEAVTYTSR